MSKKTHCTMVVLSGLSSLFCEDLRCVVPIHLMTTHEKLKLSPSTKSATADKFIITKKTWAVSNVEIAVIKHVKIKTVKPTQHRLLIFYQKFQILWCKIEINKKIECWVTFCFWVWLNLTLVLRFLISNKFYYVQTAKIVNSKNDSC